MDAIGLMITGVQDGFLRFTEIGGIDPRLLPGLRVTVHGKRDLPGVIVMPRDTLLPERKSNAPVEMKYLFIDVGLCSEETAELVSLGDLASFSQEPMELPTEIITGHSLDNRAAVAAVTICLEELHNVGHDWDVWAVATAQEEETLGGGFTAPFAIQPDLAIAIDVTFAKGPGASDYRTFPLGKGVSLGIGSNIHPGFYKAVKAVADKLDIPTHNELTPGASGTDAYAMQIVADGIATLVIGIPLRYMHTPVEMVAMKDIQRAGHLMAAFIAQLPRTFMQTLQWDD
jgi:endoglucanase